ncbi:MAG TPA: hypothetical protein VGR88_01745 [Ktedonobacterales bacterium]|nr:hypothetical protein [Ktedonobacterales bacterium]
MRQWPDNVEDLAERPSGYGFAGWENTNGNLYPPDDPTLPMRSVPLGPPTQPASTRMAPVNQADDETEPAPEAALWGTARQPARRSVPLGAAAAGGGGRMSLGCGMLATALIIGAAALAVLTHIGGPSGTKGLPYPGVQAGPAYTPTSTSTSAPSPTKTAPPTAAPDPTATPNPTATPDPTTAPDPTATPSPSGTPTPSPSPTPTTTPTSGGTPTPGATPGTTPGTTATPGVTPGATTTPGTTPGATPGATATPTGSSAPVQPTVGVV